VYDAIFQLATAINAGATRWKIVEGSYPRVVSDVFNMSSFDRGRTLPGRNFSLDPTPASVVVPESCSKCRPWSSPEACQRVKDTVYKSKACAPCLKYMREHWGTPQYAAIAVAELHKLYTAKFSSCMAKPYTAEEEQGLLTVHLRGGDVAGQDGKVHKNAWRQPPCSVYERIIEDFHFQMVVVITSSDQKHLCVAWFERFEAERSRLGRPLQVRIQSRSLSEDGCALARARHLVVSYSSFSIAFALMEQRARRIYTGGGMMNNPIPISCKFWPGVEHIGYSTKISRGGGVPGLKKFMWNTSAAAVEGPHVGCK